MQKVCSPIPVKPKRVKKGWENRKMQQRGWLACQRTESQDNKKRRKEKEGRKKQLSRSSWAGGTAEHRLGQEGRTAGAKERRKRVSKKITP